MNIEQLELISEVARTGKIAEAAVRLHLTSAAISRSITRLEQELGVQLFVRSRSGAAITEEGRRIVQQAESVLRGIEELRAEAAKCQDDVNAKLSVATVPAPTALLLQALFELRQELPSLDLEIAEKGTEEVIDDIRQGKADVGLIVSEGDARYSNIRLEKIADGKLELVVSPEHPFAQRTYAGLEDLRGLPLVIYPDNHLEAIVSALGPSAKVLFRTNNRDALLLAVRLHMAATIGTDYSFRGIQQDSGIVSVPLSIQPSSDISLWLVTPRDRKVSRGATLLASRLRKQLAASGASD